MTAGICVNSEKDINGLMMGNDASRLLLIVDMLDETAMFIWSAFAR